MQSFPKDSRDEFEIENAKNILQFFPSYKSFWEKFIGDSYKYKYVLTPREPSFPTGYSKDKIKKMNELHILMNKLSYSIFCNLVSAEKLSIEYKKTLPLTNSYFAFWAIEDFESAYFHIGNIKYALHNLWTGIKMVFFPKTYISYDLASYLKSIGKDKNWILLNDEPDNIRTNLVHLCRHTFRQINKKLYLPDYVKKKQYLWNQINTGGWVTAEEKLDSHIKIVFDVCEDFYSSIIPVMEKYLTKEGIKI